MKLFKFVFKGTKKETFGDFYVGEHGNVYEIYEDEGMDGNMSSEVERHSDVEVKINLFKCLLYSIDKFFMRKK